MLSWPKNDFLLEQRLSHRQEHTQSKLNSYRPYIEGASEEEAALANLDLALKMFDMQTTGRGAAIIVEPVISAGGVLVPPKAFMQALRQAADDRGMLLIFDEVWRDIAVECWATSQVDDGDVF